MKVVLLGSPGVGKGTYAKILTEMFDMISISTGDLFRKNVKEETEIGLKAKGYMDKGELVPDSVVIDMLKDRVNGEEKGFFLDGFPRTIPQADALDEFMQIDKVLNFNAPDEVIIDRLAGRRTCKKCGAIFHMKNIPPKVDGVCDHCGGELFQRDDDKPETIKERLRVYRESTQPLIEFYKEKGLLAEIDATKNIDVGKEEIIGACKKALESIE